jgi:hypothetical protein
VILSLRLVCARESRLGRVHTALEAKFAGDLRYERLVPVGSDTDLDLVREVDAVDELDEPVHEVLPGLLAVGHDVDAAILLQLEGEQGGVALGALEFGAGEPPGRPQAVRLREPGRLRQATGDGGLEHRFLRPGSRASRYASGRLPAIGRQQAQNVGGAPII